EDVFEDKLDPPTEDPCHPGKRRLSASGVSKELFQKATRFDPSETTHFTIIILESHYIPSVTCIVWTFVDIHRDESMMAISCVQNVLVIPDFLRKTILNRNRSLLRLANVTDSPKFFVSSVCT
ncbi:unnamed protein product, partial [Allacma fusca]